MPCCFSCLKFYADSVWHFENSNHLSNLCLTRLSDWEAMPTLFFSPSYLLKTSEIEGTDSALCCWVNFNSLPFLDSEVRLHPLYYNFKRPPSAKLWMDSYKFTSKLVPTMIWKVGEKIPTLDAKAGRWKTGIVFYLTVLHPYILSYIQMEFLPPNPIIAVRKL